MTQAPASIFKIPTESPQLARGAVSRARKASAKLNATGLAAGRVVSFDTRAATRGDGEVIELDLGITVYPPRDEGGRWRAKLDATDVSHMAGHANYRITLDMYVRHHRRCT